MSTERGLSFFFVGLGVGVALGMLFAPKSGQETRNLIIKTTGEGKQYLRRRGEEIVTGAEELVERGKTAVQREKEHIAAAVAAGKQAYRETVREEGTAPSET